MTLEFPFPCFGIIYGTDYLPLPGATVTVQDRTTLSTIDSTISGANGEYFLDVSAVADAEGDSIRVTATYGTGYAQGSFTLDLSGEAQRLDLRLDTGVLLGNSTTLGDVFMPQPDLIVESIIKKVMRRRFRDNSFRLADDGKTSEGITMEGLILDSSLLDDIDTLMEEGALITLSNMSDTNLNGYYFIEDFGYPLGEGKINQWWYTLTMVKKY